MTASRPALVAEKPKARRLLAAIVPAVALALLAGGTYAAWTDAEWAGSGSGYAIDSATRYNLQIANATGRPTVGYLDGLTWLDTSSTSYPDGPFEASVTSNAVHLSSSLDLYPGWSATTDLVIRNDSTEFSSLAFEIPADSVTSTYVKQRMSFQISVYRADVSGNDVGGWITAYTSSSLSFTNLASAVDLLAGEFLAPGEWVKVQITVTFDAAQTLNTNPAAVAQIQADQACTFKLKFSGQQSLVMTQRYELWQMAQTLKSQLNYQAGSEYAEQFDTAWFESWGQLYSVGSPFPSAWYWTNRFNTNAPGFFGNPGFGFLELVEDLYEEGYGEMAQKVQAFNDLGVQVMGL